MRRWAARYFNFTEGVMTWDGEALAFRDRCRWYVAVPLTILVLLPMAAFIQALIIGGVILALIVEG